MHGPIYKYWHEGLNFANLVILLHEALDFLLHDQKDVTYKGTYGRELRYFI
jgi:hypothetical protein